MLNITDSEIIMLCEALKTNITVTNMGLHCEEEEEEEEKKSDWREMKLYKGNKVGESGIRTISDTLTINTTLTALDLYDI